MNHSPTRYQSAKDKKTALTRRRLTVFAGISFASLITIGHTIGGIAGLIEGYKHTIEFVWPEHVQKDDVAVQQVHETHLLRLIRSLRQDYQAVKDKIEHAQRTDFTAVDETFSALRKLDEANPTVPYYEAEIGRIKDTAHFDSDACLKPTDGALVDLKGFHRLLFKYIEAARTAALKRPLTDQRADACYETESGLCAQRTAWVHHLLANDFYMMGVHAPDLDTALGYFREALDDAKKALKYDAGKGFAQCVPTPGLIAKLEIKLNAPSPRSLASGPSK